MYSSPSCGSCGVASAPGCSTCGDIVYGSDSGDCQVSPAQSGGAAVTPTPADPKDKWKAKTYAPDEAPLSGSRTDSTDSSEDKIRSGTGGGAGDAGTGSTPSDGAAGNRSGIPDDADETSRTTRRPESPAESSTAPDPGGLGEKVKIEPRNSRKKGPTPELDDAQDAAPTPEASSEPKSGGISLPQASRLDHVVATRDAPARERVSLRKPTRSGQLVRVADYAKTPWNAPQQAATVARHK